MRRLKTLDTVEPFVGLDYAITDRFISFSLAPTFPDDDLVRFSVMLSAKHPDFPGVLFQMMLLFAEEEGEVELDSFTCQIVDKHGRPLLKGGQLCNSAEWYIIALEDQAYAIVDAPEFREEIGRARVALFPRNLHTMH